MENRLAPAFIASHDLTHNRLSESMANRDAEIRADTHARQEARRFEVVLARKDSAWWQRGDATMVTGKTALLQRLVCQSLEKCLKREASHLMQVWEYFDTREPRLLTEVWVGSFPDIKLTNWQKEAGQFAFNHC